MGLSAAITIFPSSSAGLIAPAPLNRNNREYRYRPGIRVKDPDPYSMTSIRNTHIDPQAQCCYPGSGKIRNFFPGPELLSTAYKLFVQY